MAQQGCCKTVREQNQVSEIVQQTKVLSLYRGFGRQQVHAVAKGGC